MEGSGESTGGRPRGRDLADRVERAVRDAMADLEGDAGASDRSG